MYNNKTAKLILSNGRIFDGYAFGAAGTTIGEVCFNTGMTGYQEILTDPSYCGQLITMTYPHIGNYGINDEDIESDKIQASGLIIKEGTTVPSNFRSQLSLDSYLKKNNIVGIQGIDTRSLVRCIRDEGAMNGIISSNINNVLSLKKKLNIYPQMSGLDLARVVTCSKVYKWGNDKSKKYNVVVIDFGIKYNILRLLYDSGCNITVVPADTRFETILQYNPDGVFLSNGPGDPAAITYGIKTVQNLLKIDLPIFGICLGHQILALAFGAKTYKLKFGHRGCNHPVKNYFLDKIEITSQNHGFAVDENTIPNDLTITHISLNDNTIEGFKCKNKLAFSVQYHPEASPGPHDSQYLFKNFINNMKINKKKHAKENRH